MKLVIKRIVAAVVFVGILLGMITSVGFLVRPADSDSDNMSYLYKEDKNTLNVVCMGSSAMYRFWIPQQAYEEQNYTSAVVATAGQNIEAVPYLMEEVKKTQDVDLFVVEIRSPLADEAHRIDGKYNEDESLARLSYIAMGMKQSLNRLNLINNVLEENEENTKLEWMIPVLKYHDNIHTLSADKIVSRLNGLDDDAIFSKMAYQVNKQEQPVFEDDPNITLPDRDKQSVDRVVEKANELGVKVLLIATPYVPNKTRAALHVQMNEYINEKGYDYLDMTDKLDEIGLDLNTDFYDKNHTNIAGAQKVTNYIDTYIAQNYDIKNKLNSEQKERWNNVSKNWDETAAEMLEKWQKEVEKGDKGGNE